MTHRIVVDLQTGTVTQVEYTAEEQAVYDAAVAAQVVTPAEIAVETPTVAPIELTKKG